MHGPGTERNADGDDLALGPPPIVIAVPFMCVLLVGTLIGLQKLSRNTDSEREFLLCDITGISV